MNELLNNPFDSAGVFLGLGISFYTIYDIVRSLVIRSRQFRMLIEELRLAFGIHLELIKIISGKADRFLNEDLPKPLQQNLPVLSKGSKDALAIVVSRAEQILASSPEIDLSNWAGMLKKSQLARLMDFLEAYQLYRVRLELRLEEHKATPDRADVLGRFLSSAALHDGLSEKFTAFEKSLGVKSLKKHMD